MIRGYRKSKAFLLAKVVVCCVVAAAEPLFGLDRLQRRCRGEDLYLTHGSNTVGSGTVWVESRGTAFAWDALRDGGLLLQGLADLKVEGGIASWFSVVGRTQPVAMLYGKRVQIGASGIGLKATLLPNIDLREYNVGMELGVFWSLLKNFNSIAGYRSGGTGFSPIGIFYEQGSFEGRLCFDHDYIARFSFLPLRVSTNIGMRMPFEAEFRSLSQYLFTFAVAYVGLMADMFVEYSYEGFFNRSFSPKLFSVDWPTCQRTFEVAFSEAPMLITMGGRLRYNSGFTIFGCVPMLISSNVGSAMTYEDKMALERAKLNLNDPTLKFHEEAKRGITDPFDPWYAKWRIVLGVSFPLLYRQTASEMRRTYLLMKNLGGHKKIDIDQRLKSIQHKAKEEKAAGESASDDADAQRRLEEIKKRREEIMKGDSTTTIR